MPVKRVISIVRVSVIVGAVFAAAAASAQVVMFDPRIVDDGAKASLISRTNPGRTNDVLSRCVATAQQVAAGVRQQGQINLTFCLAFDIGVASIAGHDRLPDAAAVARETSRRVTGYLSALGVPPAQAAATLDVLRTQVGARLRTYSPT